jgi:hypothetical protein
LTIISGLFLTDSNCSVALGICKLATPAIGIGLRLLNHCFHLSRIGMGVLEFSAEPLKLLLALGDHTFRQGHGSLPLCLFIPQPLQLRSIPHLPAENLFRQ